MYQLSIAQYCNNIYTEFHTKTLQLILRFTYYNGFVDIVKYMGLITAEM